MILRVERFENIWDAIEDTPAAAEEMKRRSALMIALQEHVRHEGWTNQETARRLDASEDRIALLLEGDINVFDESSLASLCRAAGISADQVSKWR
jgi:predicted XRE-type DNA-binding protein